MTKGLVADLVNLGVQVLVFGFGGVVVPATSGWALTVEKPDEQVFVFDEEPKKEPKKEPSFKQDGVFIAPDEEPGEEPDGDSGCVIAEGIFGTDEASRVSDKVWETNPYFVRLVKQVLGGIMKVVVTSYSCEDMAEEKQIAGADLIQEVLGQKLNATSVNKIFIFCQYPTSGYKQWHLSEVGAQLKVPKENILVVEREEKTAQALTQQGYRVVQVGEGGFTLKLLQDFIKNQRGNVNLSFILGYL